MLDKEEPKPVESSQEENNTTNTDKVIEEENNDGEKTDLGKFVFDASSSDYPTNNGYGKVQVTGYPYEEKIESYGDSVNYVFFKVVNASDNNFMNYLNNLDGNTFARKDAIGLGCLDNDTLKRIVFYGNSEMNTYTLSKADTSEIMNSSKDKPITLNFEKLKLYQGIGEVDLCSSHMTHVSIAK